MRNENDSKLVSIDEYNEINKDNNKLIDIDENDKIHLSINFFYYCYRYEYS